MSEHMAGDPVACLACAFFSVHAVEIRKLQEGVDACERKAKAWALLGVPTSGLHSGR